MQRLSDVFTSPADLLQLEPEELAGVLVEVIPAITQNGIFGAGQIATQAFEAIGGGWPWDQKTSVDLAIAEAINWLCAQGLVMVDPGQSGGYWLRFTRRGQALKTRADVESYRRAGALPLALLQAHLADKVRHLFVRGDHDTAVFQAFKEVEVAVRRACGFGDEVLGRALMARAFDVRNGPLRNAELIESERQAEFFLFSGAIGHAKNPTSHREVSLSREEAARLIVFAGHLLAIVEERAAKQSLRELKPEAHP